MLLPGIAHCQQRPTPSMAEMERMREWVRDKGESRKENISRIGDRVKLEKRNSFQINAFFGKEFGRGSRYVLADDARAYEFLILPSVHAELGLSQRTEEEIAQKARALTRQWEKVWSEFTETGDAAGIERFENNVSVFEKTIAAKLSSNEKEALRTISIRTKIKDIGLPEFLKSHRGPLALSDENVSEIVGELEVLAKQIASRSNWEFVKIVDELMPGFLKQPTKEEIDRLPLMPCSSIIALLEDSTKIEEVAKECFSKYRIDIEQGDWMFPGPVFDLDRTGRVNVSIFSRQNWMPTPAFLVLYEHVATDLTQEQMNDLLTIIQYRNASGTLVENGLSRADTQFKIFELRQQQLLALKESLLPEQLRPVKNYVRLHSLFTLGPEIICKRIDAENVTKLFTDRVKKQVAANQLEFARTACKLVNEQESSRGQRSNNAFKLTIEHLYFEGQPDFDTLILPFLRQE